MSLARQKRMNILANLAAASSASEGGDIRPAATAQARAAAAAEHDRLAATDAQVPSLARAARMKVLAKLAGDAADISADASGTEAEPSTIEGQMRLRLIHDLRRLKDIKSVMDNKVAAKREMMPHYMPWVHGLLAAKTGVQEEILPTMMIWAIDTGDFRLALDLAEHVLRHEISLPSRYQRDALTFVVEQISEAALTSTDDETVPLEILDAVDELAEGRDLHDPVRAKLMKAIGLAELRREEKDPEAADVSATRTRALAALREAMRLDPRCGVKTKVEQLAKRLNASAPAPTTPDTPPPSEPDAPPPAPEQTEH